MYNGGGGREVGNAMPVGVISKQFLFLTSERRQMYLSPLQKKKELRGEKEVPGRISRPIFYYCL